MTIRARPSQQQQQSSSQSQTRRPPQVPTTKASPGMSQVQTQRPQPQVQGGSGEMSCFLCPANTNRKSYPDSRLKAHLFAMHGRKVTQTAIRCNMCSFAAESVRQL